jgi:FHA domain
MAQRLIPEAHQLAFFSLEPLNDRAHAVLAHPENSCYVSKFVGVGSLQTLGLDIGLNICSKKRFTLATLGRNGADITLEGPNISAIHCSFEVHQESGEIMLHDLSRYRSTQTFGEDARPFENGRNPRSVVVAYNLNTSFGIGGARSDMIQFRLIWHRRAFDVAEQVKSRPHIPRLAPTIEGNDVSTEGPSAYNTRTHTPSSQGLGLRYARRLDSVRDPLEWSRRW